tara:strand:+ start:170 stop:958 length:789 start_codon:yes stop_codon:yes gene_type:complete
LVSLETPGLQIKLKGRAGKNIAVKEKTDKMHYNFEFSITTYCQASCPSCARTLILNSDTPEKLKIQHMDFAKFKTIVKDESFLWGMITFCGEHGDPMMHPQIEEFIDVAFNSSGKGVRVCTNGGLRDEEFYIKLAKKYNEHPDLKKPRKTLVILFGIDGSTHELNNKYRIGVDTDQALKNLKAYKRHNGVGYWEYLIFDHNWKDIIPAAELAKKIKTPIRFKFNERVFGKISDKNKVKADLMLNDVVLKIHPRVKEELIEYV